MVGIASLTAAVLRRSCILFLCLPICGAVHEEHGKSLYRCLGEANEGWEGKRTASYLGRFYFNSLRSPSPLPLSPGPPPLTLPPPLYASLMFPLPTLLTPSSGPSPLFLSQSCFHSSSLLLSSPFRLPASSLVPVSRLSLPPCLHNYSICHLCLPCLSSPR